MILLRILIASLFFILSCSDPFQYNPNEIKLNADEKGINLKNISRIIAAPESDTLKIAILADIHHEYENLENFVQMINFQGNIDFVMTIGDISNFGIQSEFREVNNRLKKLKVPYITIIGNHDLLGRGKELFEEMFGSRDFAFARNKIKFICMDTNSREYHFNGLVPDIGWLQANLADTAEINQIFVLGHVPPFSSDFDDALKTHYVSSLSNSSMTSVSFHGHSNRFSYSEYYFDGVIYVEVDNLEDRAYVLLQVYKDYFFIESKTF